MPFGKLFIPLTDLLFMIRCELCKSLSLGKKASGKKRWNNG